MKEENYWQQFLNTGRIEDYLFYKQQNKAEEKQKKEEHSDAGAVQRYRNHIESGTFRGI